MFTAKLSIKKHPSKLPTKRCLQSYLSETLSCSSPIRSGFFVFFLGGRWSCRQEKWRKNSGSQPSHSSAHSVVKIHAGDSSLLCLKQITPHRIYSHVTIPLLKHMKLGSDGKLLYYEVQQIQLNLFRYSNIRSLLMTYIFHKLIQTRLTNC